MGVILFNNSSLPFNVERIDVAQLICQRIIKPKLKGLLSSDSTERDIKGFDSTGGISVSNNSAENDKLIININELLAED